MHLIAGLGNPGAEYAGNRHNIGFMAVDAIAAHFGLPAFRAKFNALITDGTVDSERVLLIKPQTFMNRSGDALAQATKFYKLGPEDVTVIYDELDLAPGKVRVKTGGGNGGHNGLRSIDPAIGTAYQRVRVGIGHPGHKELVTRHVLGDFAKADAQWLEPLLDAIGANAPLLARGEGANFMNKVSLAMQGAGTADGTAGKAPPENKPAPKKQSHVPQARTKQPAQPPETGPMASMLKKLFNKD